jgi:hypothetical protein
MIKLQSFTNNKKFSILSLILGYRDKNGKEKYRFVAGQFGAGFYYEDEGLDDDVDQKVKKLSEIWLENLIN